MKNDDLMKDIESKIIKGELSEKRFTCAQCGRTWIELVGLIVGQKEGHDDYCLRVGMESENCQICRYRSLECPACSSKDVYEITFANETSEKTSFNFKDLKIVSKMR